jgi:hypothetical protein
MLTEAKHCCFPPAAKFCVRVGAVQRELHSLYQGKLEPEINGAGPVLEVRQRCPIQGGLDHSIRVRQVHRYRGSEDH